MRILQVVPHYIPAFRFGGPLQMAHALSKALVRLGHSVSVCTTNLKDRCEDIGGPSGATARIDGVTVFYEPVHFSRYWGFSLALARRLRREVAKADVVFIHFHYQFASLIGGWISRRLHKPYIIFTHGSLNHYGLQARGYFYKRLYLSMLERKNFLSARFVAYHSEEEMENSLRLGRVEVVPNGIDPQEFEATPDSGFFRHHYPELEDKTVFLYLGRLDEGKGLDLLLPAFHRLAQEFPDVHLVLAGGDERGYVTRVRRTISELALTGRVTLTGLIGGPLKLAALRDADVFVLPSRSEGLSMAMLEAMYMGLPVVVTNRMGFWRQITKHRCGLVVDLSEDRLAEAFRQIKESRDRREMGERGRQLVASTYTWDIIARKLMSKF